MRIRVANPHLRPAQFFNLIRVESTILCKSRDPPSTQSVFPIHNSIGRAFSCTVFWDFPIRHFNTQLSQIFFSPTGKTSSWSFCVKTSFLFVKKIFLCVHLLPSRQTPPRHTGTPPVSYSDELSILIRFSVIFSATVFLRLCLLLDRIFPPKLCNWRFSITFGFTFHVYTIPSRGWFLILTLCSLLTRAPPHSRPPGPDP